MFNCHTICRFYKQVRKRSKNIYRRIDCMEEPEIKKVLADLLMKGILNICKVESLDEIEREVYHLHNLPLLIAQFDLGALRYYF